MKQALYAHMNNKRKMKKKKKTQASLGDTILPSNPQRSILTALAK
jgi:hypothetical protein